MSETVAGGIVFAVAVGFGFFLGWTVKSHNIDSRWKRLANDWRETSKAAERAIEAWKGAYMALKQSTEGHRVPKRLPERE